MTPETAQVPAAGNTNGVPSQPAGTPNQVGTVPQSGTPSTPTVDAEALRKMQEEYAKATQDINNIKSTFQKREAELNKRLADQRKEYEDQIQQRTMASMDEDEKEKYLSQVYRQRAEELEQRQQELEAQLAMESNFKASLNYFVDSGVPLSALKRDGDVQELVQSGYDWLRNRVKELEGKVSNPAAPASPVTPSTPAPAAPPAAPRVDTNTGAPAATQSYAERWEALIEKYGSMAKVYQLVERRQLPASVIPLRPE